MRTPGGSRATSIEGARWLARLLVVSQLGCAVTEPVETLLPSQVTMVTFPTPDTVESRATAPTVVVVRDAVGRPIPGLQIYFATLRHYPADHWAIPVPEVLLAPPGTSDPHEFTEYYATATNAEGRTSFHLKRGRHAGGGRVVVATATKVFDTLHVEILPGAATGVQALPADTTMYIDRTLALRSRAVDRHGNFRDDAVAYAAGQDLTVTGPATVAASSHARSFVVASSGSFEDTTWVSVVPRGQVLAVRHWEGDRPFLLMELDGSSLRSIPGLLGTGSSSPTWTADGARFVYSTYSFQSAAASRLMVAETTGVANPLLPSGTFHHANFPRRSKDGEWLYFSAQVAAPPYELWRSRWDGSDLEKLGDDLGGFDVDWRPDPTFDGGSVLFTTLGTSENGGWGVRILQLSDGAVGSWILPGLAARASPVDARVAVIPNGDGSILISDHAGTVTATVPTGSGHGGGVGADADWSPDGKWLVVTYHNKLHLIEVDTGLLLPVAWATAMSQPAWRPLRP